MLSLITAAGLVLSTLSSFWMVDCLLRPSLRQLAGIRAKQIAIENIHHIIQSKIIPELEYSQLIELSLTNDGRVAYMQPKTGAINRISSNATLSIQQQLKKLPQEMVRIPLGQVFGIKTLASYGPLLPVKLIPVGVVESSIKDQFDSVGINQVRHKILISIKTTIKMVVPLVREEIIVATDVPLTETIIMGDVPDFYLGSGGMLLQR
ncbi:MAG: sporulation protein YunB [Bacteroidota bacterium]